MLLDNETSAMLVATAIITILSIATLVNTNIR